MEKPKPYKSIAFSKYFYSFLCIACGVIALLGARSVGGILFFVAGILIASCYRGIDINYEEKSIRRFQSILWIKSGQVLAFKDFNYILLSEGAVDGGRESAYKIFLIPINKNKYQSILLGDYIKLKDVIQVGEEYGEAFKLEVKSNLKGRYA